jgi:hypothetical protein
MVVRTSPTTGQPSTQVTGARNVSRPSTCQPGGPPRGRVPRKIIHQEPSAAWTRSPCPVLWIGWSVLRWLRIGLCGHGSNGPSGAGPRATEMPWPASVPPSAISRYQVPSTSYRCGASGHCAPGVPDQIVRGSPSAAPLARSTRTWLIPAYVHQAVPSASQARSGSIPTSGNHTGSDHGPAGSVLVTTIVPACGTTEVIRWNRPSW